jgi:6-phosphogluconolactonase
MSSSASFSPSVLVFPSSSSLSSSLASDLLALSSSCISSHASFTVAFSGGSLPKLAATGLLDESIKSKIEWSKWHFLFVDERCVGLESKDSNSRELREQLINKVPEIKQEQIIDINPLLLSKPDEMAEDYERRVKKVLEFSVGTCDCVLLGLGPDGHTASLFPQHALLEEKNKLIAAIYDSPKLPPQRITFTLPLINQSKAVRFVVTGDKKEAVRLTLEESQLGMPGSRVLVKDCKFYLDQEAASALKSAKL